MVGMKVMDKARANMDKLPDNQKRAIGTLMEFTCGNKRLGNVYECFKKPDKINEKKLAKIANKFIKVCSDDGQFDIMKELPLSEKKIGRIGAKIEEKREKLKTCGA